MARIISFIQLWPKLAQDDFLTFRFERKDKPHFPGEIVQIAYKARSKKDHSILGLAVIKKVELHWITNATDNQMAHRCDYPEIKVVSQNEAKQDGFDSREAMVGFMRKQYGHRHIAEPMVRIDLTWTQRWLRTPEQKPHIAERWALLLK